MSPPDSGHTFHRPRCCLFTQQARTQCTCSTQGCEASSLCGTRGRPARHILQLSLPPSLYAQGPAHLLNRMHAVGSNKFPSVGCSLCASHYRHYSVVSKQRASKVHAQSCFSHEDPEAQHHQLNIKKSPGQGEDEHVRRRSPISRGGPGKDASWGRGKGGWPHSCSRLPRAPQRGSQTDVPQTAWCSPALLWVLT